MFSPYLLGSPSPLVPKPILESGLLQSLSWFPIIPILALER